MRLFVILWIAGSMSCGGNSDPSDPLDAGLGGPAPVTDAGPTEGDTGRECPADCPPDQCFGRRCVVSPSPECTNDAQCSDGQRCSVAGLCFEGACQTHGDCDATERCHTGRCLARIESAAGVQFERLYMPSIQAHRSVPPIPDFEADARLFAGGTGFGLALLDIDGDLDLDLFIGSEGGTPACLYRNESRPTQPRFEAIEASCNGVPGHWQGAAAMDLEGDGLHELIKLGPARIEVQRFAPVAATQDLIAELPADDPRRQCNAGSAIAQDFNYDGRVDLLVGCHLDMVSGTQETFKNLLFLQDEQTQLRFVDRDQWVTGDAVIHELESSTLAIGAADLNDDGLGDLIVNEDILVHLVMENPDPGGVYFACPPDEDCRFTVQRFASGDRAKGAYMGSGVLRVGDHPAHHLYVTDIADNRLLRGTDSGFRDVTSRANAAIGYLGGEGVYGWGVIVDDFDFDGQDDLFVANGAVPGHTIADFAMHLDLLLLQKEPGRFGWYSADVGIDPFTTQDSGHEERAFASRAAVKADLDLDQQIDIITAGMEGAPRVHREIPLLDNPNKRCTLVPMPRYVPGFGSGHQLVLPDDPRPRLWDSQGQVRSGTSPFLLSPFPTGTVIFPSGARVAFDCSNSVRPQLVLEPDWIRFERAADQLEIHVSPEAPEGELSVLVEGESTQAATLASPGTWTAAWPGDGRRIMLRFGGRWTARWFELD